MGRTVHLHVGLPKTGTTYLQDRLHADRAELARHGTHYPVGLRGDMFLAALDLLDRPWGGQREEARGEWDALVRRANRARGSVLISHEILAGVSADRAERALDSFGGAEVHVVLTVRDVARQLPAEWQERLKHQRTMRYGKFRNRVLDPGRSTETGRLFWQVQDVPEVLTRWSRGLDPARVHVVTVPPPGAPAGELWRRFCEATGLDPAHARTQVPPRNPSLGVAQCAMLRRLNVRLRDSDLTHADYRDLVRTVLVHGNLATGQARDRLVLAPQDHAWAEDVAARWTEFVTASGFTVHGDLADLRPAPPVAEDQWRDPDRVRPRRVAAATMDALVAMVEEAARREDPEHRLSSKLSKAARRLRER